MCQSKEQGGRRCAGALTRQRDKKALTTAEKRYQETGVASLGLITSQKSLDEAVERKEVNARSHSRFPEVVVYDYSTTSHFARNWTNLITECRGLIVNKDTGEILARPFKKFYNHEESDVEDNQFPRTGPIDVMEKSDGSMGILATMPDGSPLISTRGSMESLQAQHATALYAEKYAGQWNPDPEYTYCFEIIYPDNRIVVNYGDTDDIVLLGARHKVTGVSATREQLAAAGWPGPEVKRYSYESFEDVLAHAEKGIPGEEGFVVHFTDHDKRVKLKFAEYLRIHRAVSDLSPLRVHEALMEGKKLSDSPDFPDEFYDEVRRAEKRLEDAHAKKRSALTAQHEEYRASLPEGYTMKEFALGASQRYDKQEMSLLISLELGRDNIVDEKLWKQVRPHGEMDFEQFLGDKK